MDTFLRLIGEALAAIGLGAAAESGRRLVVWAFRRMTRSAPAPPSCTPSCPPPQGETNPLSFAETNIRDLLKRLEDIHQAEKEGRDGGS